MFNRLLIEESIYINKNDIIFLEYLYNLFL